MAASKSAWCKQAWKSLVPGEVSLNELPTGCPTETPDTCNKEKKIPCTRRQHLQRKALIFLWSSLSGPGPHGCEWFPFSILLSEGSCKVAQVDRDCWFSKTAFLALLLFQFLCAGRLSVVRRCLPTQLKWNLELVAFFPLLPSPPEPG